MNSRFAALMEETPVIKKQDTQLKEKPKELKTNSNHFRDDNRQHFSYHNQSRYSPFKSPSSEIKKEIKISVDDLEMFPSLINSISNNIPINMENIVSDISFIDKVKMVNEIETETQNEEDILEKGWISLKRDKDNKIIYDNSKFYNEHDEYDDWNLITEKINNNYLLWKTDYIDKWGEDEFEKMYKFPNYDYEYFDKLDEEYEKEMAYEFEFNNDESLENYDNYDYENDSYNWYTS